MRPEQKQQLTELVQNSPTLKEERKEMILKAMEHLNEEQGDKLIKVFQDAKKRYMEIESKYSGAALEVKKEYLEKANEFTRHEITEAFQVWEAAEEKKEEAELEKIEDQIKKLPE
jgi:hypothetical protein